MLVSLSFSLSSVAVIFAQLCVCVCVLLFEPLVALCYKNRTMKVLIQISMGLINLIQL